MQSACHISAGHTPAHPVSDKTRAPMTKTRNSQARCVVTTVPPQREAAASAFQQAEMSPIAMTAGPHGDSACLRIREICVNSWVFPVSAQFLLYWETPCFGART